MDTQLARFNMVEQQIRPWNVLDQRILDLFLEVPREKFVKPEYKNLAFADIEIPLGNGSKMLPPKIEAKMIQELQLKDTDILLEVGTGNAYVTAIMAKLCKHVYSFDLDQNLIHSAMEKLKDSHNVTLSCADGLLGSKHAPFDAIMIGGAIEEIPDILIKQLNVGGRLIAVVGKDTDRIQEATLFTKISENSVLNVILFETHVSSLNYKINRNDQEFVF